MNTNDPLTEDTIEQQLLELHYGLLDEAEATELRARIESDADTAAAWARTLKMVSQFADAAKLEGVNLKADVKADDETAVPSSAVERAAESVDSHVTPAKGPSYGIIARRFVNAVLAVAASIALVIVGTNFQKNYPNSPNVALRIQAEPVKVGNETAENAFEITTSRLAGSSGFRVMPASISLSILSGGNSLYETEATTDNQGRYQFNVPDGLKVPSGSSLKVFAAGQGQSGSATISIPLEPTRCLTYLTVDKPVYRPGETVWYRSLTLERYSMRPDVDLPISI